MKWTQNTKGLIAAGLTALGGLLLIALDGSAGWLFLLFALFVIFSKYFPSFFANLTAVEQGFGLDELSDEQVTELRRLVKQDKLAAIKHLMATTGAGPTVAKAYLDGLERGTTGPTS